MPVQTLPETRRLLLKLALLRGLDELELMQLLDHADVVTYSDGEYPLVEGEEGSHMFVVLSGQARICKRSRGILKMLRELGPGECFGEMALVEQQPRSATVRTVGSCKLLRLDTLGLKQVPTASAKIYRNIAVQLSGRLRHANSMITLG